MNRSIAGWVTHRWAKWVVTALGLVMIFALASLGAKLTSVQDNDAASWLPGDAESTKVIERSKAFSDPNDIPGVVLYVRDAGITPADVAKATADSARIKGVDSVTEVTGPIPADDGKALQVLVTIRMSSDGWEDLPDRVDDIRSIADRDAGGLDVRIAGPAALGADQAESFAGIDGILLLAAVAIVFIILLITYRSLQLAILFLLCGVGAVFSAQGLVYLLAKHADLTVNAQSAGILSVLVLGAGVDYALLLVARYREELHRYEDRHEAMAHALHRAAPAVLASGATVIIGLLCLLFAQMNSTSSLGPVGAVGIACALLVMMLLLPALLVILGRWIFWPFVPRFGDPIKSETGIWARVGRRIAKAPRAVWVTTTLILVALSFGVVQLDANGLTNAQSFTKEQPSVLAERELAKHFPGGAGSPVAVIAEGSRADAVKDALSGVEGIDASSVQVLSPAGSPVAYLEGTLTSAPDSADAFATIDRARDAVHDVAGADALVGGNTAVNKDVQAASGADNRLIIPIILGVVLLILATLLRSIAAPLMLLVTVVVSFAAAMGISALTFRHVFGFEGTDSSFPLFAFVFLVALGIDYNIFLMTRVREESLKHGTRKGALIGLAATGGVITSAGFVLAGTFTALATLPVVFLAELGFAVAVGVLLDTIIVRSVLVTALNLDFGRHIWWPSALGRTDGQAHEEVDRTSTPREAART
ncbi:MMPL family transporter [Aeromicrobium wangtongii]|uniref:MMPL family transporter n=1 Tax=Aeromicrobium wangtongii TaxID=2969247 RepID=UPI00201743DE|nr:MMPL family transporter [Aeromicrobium wangtongii]MCL3818183.1 MMPL family transporter [Aeromicrobium wangtongii]